MWDYVCGQNVPVDFPVLKYHFMLLMQCNGINCYNTVINLWVNFHVEEVHHKNYISTSSTLLPHNTPYYKDFHGLVSKYSDEEKSGKFSAHLISKRK